MRPSSTAYDRLASASSPARRRISRARRAVGLLVLVGLCGLGAAYYYHTRPERVLQRAREFFQQLTNGEVTIGGAEFELFRGIHLREVHIGLPPGDPFHPADSTSRQREVFHAAQLYLKHDWWSLLLGRAVVREILAADAVFTLVRRTDGGRYNWQELLVVPGRHGPLEHLPIVRLQEVSVCLRQLEDDRQRELDRIELNLLASPDKQAEATYVVRWLQRGEQRRDGLLRLDLRRGSFDASEGGLPTMSIEAVLAALPGDVQTLAHWLALLDLRGRLGVEALAYDPDRPGQATVRLDDLALSIPLDEEEQRLPPDERLLRLQHVSGQIDWDGDQVKTALTGRLNGKDCRLAGLLYGSLDADLTWEAVGFDLQLGVEDFELPELTDQPDDSSTAFVHRFAPLAYLYERFDPHGRFNLEFQLARDPQVDQGVRLERARITAVGADARYAKFPARVHELRGVIDFGPEGITLRDLRGSYGGGDVVVNGRCARISPGTGVEMIIEGRDLPLDDELFNALRDEHQKVWRMFAPEGTVNTRVDLYRPDSGTDRGAPHDVVVDIELLGVDARFAQLPYALHDVRGRLRVDKTGVAIEGLEGRHGSAVVRSSGSSVPDGAGGRIIDTHLSATDLMIDEELVSALPPGAQEAINTFGLEGRADLAGRIFTDPQTKEVTFDLTGRLYDARARHRQIPLPVDGIHGALRLRPGRVDLEDWRGLHGRAAVEASGTVWIGSDRQGAAANLRLRCAAVDLTADLREALPERFARTWEQLGASGQVLVDLEYTRGSAAQVGREGYRLSVEPLAASIQSSRFPWPIEGVTGRVVVTPSRIAVEELRGRHEEAEVRLHGWFDAESGEAQLSLDATDVSLNEALRQAVPWRIRRTWNVLGLAGRVDLHLPVLRRERAPDGTPRWSFQGDVVMDGVDLDAGVEIRQASGVWRGSGMILGEEQKITAEANVEIGACRVNQYAVSDARFDFRRGVDPPLVLLEDIAAQACGGRLAGRVEVRTGQPSGRYDYSLVIEDADLGPLLAARDGSPSSATRLRGKVEASLYHTGEFDRPGRGRGGGEVRVQGGALFRVPLMLELLQVLTPLPAPGPRQDASARFFIADGELNFQTLQVRDRHLLLSGSGTMQMQNRNLQIVLVAGAPAPTDRDTPLSIVQELLEGAARELIEIRIIGPLSNPQFEAQPLRGIDQAIRVLTGSEERR